VFEKIDFRPGIITYNDFDIDLSIPLNEGNDALKEDMFQVEYPFDYILDTGWYSGIKQFIVYVTKSCNWDEPIVKKKCKDISELERAMEECHNLIKSLMEK
jgi:hypothetical protein